MTNNTITDSKKTDQPEQLIQALLEISSLIVSDRQLDWILKQIVRITSDVMQIHICSIYLLEKDGSLIKRSNVGLTESLSQQASFKESEGIPGWVAEHGLLAALPDVTKDPRYGLGPDITRPHAYIASPLIVDGRTIGVLTAREMKVMEFTPNQCRLFETISRMVAIVIHKHRTGQEKTKALHLAAIGTSLSEIAHYVKNIMFTTQVAESSIHSFIKEHEDLEQIQESWLNLRRSNQKIRKLVGDMLSYCRERKPHFEDADINDIIKLVVQDLNGHSIKHNVRVATDLEESITGVRLDPSSIHDVLLNLITNSIDAIPENEPGLITIRTRLMTDLELYRIEVEDNGMGIPNSIKDKVFSLFFSTKGEKGTGIGLAATKKSIERHAGMIKFETTPGEGTTFIILLPINPEHSIA